MKNRSTPFMAIAMILFALISVESQKVHAEEPILDRIVISSGASGRSYYSTAIGMKSLIDSSDVMSIASKEVEVQTSKGGVENINKTYTGVSNVGFTQADVFASMLETFPNLSNVLIPIGVTNREYVFIAINPESKKVRSIKDLMSTTNKAVISVGPKGSSGALTWNYICCLAPELKAATIDSTTATDLALSQLGINSQSSLSGAVVPDCVLFIGAPNAKDKYIKTVISRKLEFIDVDLSKLEKKSPVLGRKIYSVDKIGFSTGGFFDMKVTTIYTESMVIARKDLKSELMSMLISSLPTPPEK